MAFWGTPLGANQRDPKRKFRFQVQIGPLGDNSVVWYAKSVEKPKMSINSDTTHKYLGHTFKFPGSVTWEDISVVLVDPADPNTNGKDAARELLTIVEGSGYRFPTAANVTQTINKSDSVNSLGPVIIKQLDGDGVIIEQWKLHNPFIKEVSFDGLDYESDDLSEITLGIVYDWAELEKAADGSDPALFE